MEVGQGPHWGSSAKGKKYIYAMQCNAMQCEDGIRLNSRNAVYIKYISHNVTHNVVVLSTLTIHLDLSPYH
jgi:hypothetical protein